MKVSLALLVSLGCLALAASREAESPHRLVKRDIFDDIRNALNKVGDTFGNVFEQIKNFTADKYADFKQSLKNLSKTELEKTRAKLGEYYDTMTDKTTAEAQRLKDTLDEIDRDIAAASGSQMLKGSAIAATLLVLLSIAALH